MKKVRGKDAERIKVSNSCTAYEYPLKDEDINVAIIEINGRYPDAGRTVNEECKELVYVMSGKCKLVVEDVETELEKGDTVIIDPGEKFYWIGNNVKLCMPCTPAWYPEQHKEVD